MTRIAASASTCGALKAWGAAARYLWAMLLARIHEVLPPTCPFCHAARGIIAFSTQPSVRLRPVPVSRFASLRTLLWEAATAAAASNAPAWDHTLPPAPDLEFDQRIAW